MEVLDLVGLTSRAFEKVKTFSHGMKQRLGIAQALLTKPELIILDEPTAGLDPQGMKEVRDLIKELSAESKMTIFLSTHLLSEVEQVATRMAVINRGELIAQGSVSELLDQNRPITPSRSRPMTRLSNSSGNFPGLKSSHPRGARWRCVWKGAAPPS